MGINILQNITLDNEKLIFNGIVCAIDMHRQAMKLISRYKNIST